MQRRDFMTLVGGTAVASPFVTRAQQPERVRLIGIVTGFAADVIRRPVAAFRDKLKELGWVDGHNVRIDLRIAGGDYKQQAEHARALIELPADVIVTTGTPGLRAARDHTRSVPVVFTLVVDPVGQKLIQSLARPGENATGFTNFEFPIGGKWLELLGELDPRVRHVTVLANPANPISDPFSRFIEETGRAMVLDVATAFVRDGAEMAAAIGAVAKQSGGAIIVLPDGLAVVQRKLIIEAANRHRLTVMYPFRLFAESGGLMSYGIDVAELFRQVAVYVDRILRGANPGELPVQAPSTLELVLNLNTAQTLGLAVPEAFMARVDEFIE
jgi:putative ABC transport system substrate-binding protein